MLIGMFEWLVIIGRLDLSHALTSLNKFRAYPHEYHLDLAVHIFRYLKQVPSLVIAIDPKLLDYNCTANYAKLIPDFSQDYPDTYEKVDNQLLQAFGSWLQTNIIVDSDYAPDLKTGCSLFGLIYWVGSYDRASAIEY